MRGALRFSERWFFPAFLYLALYSLLYVFKLCFCQSKQIMDAARKGGTHYQICYKRVIVLFVFLHKTETERIELLHDLFERFSSEVAHLHHILFGLVN